MPNSIDPTPPLETPSPTGLGIPFSGQITRREFLRAQRLFYQPSPAAWVGRIAMAALIIAYGALLASTIGQRWFLWFSLIAGLIVLATPWTQPYLNLWMQWPAHILVREPWRGLATERGLRLEGEHFREELTWGALLMHKRSADMVLLYPRPRSFVLLPRSLFAGDADWQALGELVARQTPRRMVPGQDRGEIARRITLVIAAIALLAMLVWLLRNRAAPPEEMLRETVRVVQSAAVSRAA